MDDHPDRAVSLDEISHAGIKRHGHRCLACPGIHSDERVVQGLIETDEPDQVRGDNKPHTAQAGIDRATHTTVLWVDVR